MQDLVFPYLSQSVVRMDHNITQTHSIHLVRYDWGNTSHAPRVKNECYNEWRKTFVSISDDLSSILSTLSKQTHHFHSTV